MFFPKHSVVKTIWYRELYSGWTLKIIFQGLVGCASFFLKRREKTNFNAHICFNFMFRFFCVVAWSQKLYIYSMGKKSSKSSMNRKRFFTFYKKKFFLPNFSLLSYNKEKKKYNLIYCVFEASFHARICHQKLFYAFCHAPSSKIEKKWKNFTYLLQFLVFVLYVIKKGWHEPIISTIIWTSKYWNSFIEKVVW